MALELSKLTGQVREMGLVLASRQRDQEVLAEQAQQAIQNNAEVTELLREKIRKACTVDTSWRGAEPLGDRLDERQTPLAPPQPATLIAVDGSQIYPDRHGVAAYFLLNIGSITLRYASNQAPEVDVRPTVYYQEADLYDELGQLRDAEYVNRLRSRQELTTLAERTAAERTRVGGDLAYPVIALSDGPLLPWAPERPSLRPDARQAEDSLQHFIAQMDCLRQAAAIPVGYIDRPHSAYVLRTLAVAELELDAITREKVRRSHYRSLSDRVLFAGLAPNQRTGLFASTSQVNRRCQELGHRIVFFYANVARRPGTQNALVVRIDVPEWAASGRNLDLLQQAIYADCELTGYPYVLARAHELAVVTAVERHHLDGMIQETMWRSGLRPRISTKAGQKLLTGGKPGRR